MYGERLARWNKLTEWPLTTAATAFLAAYALQIISRPDGLLEIITEATIWITWAIFLADYLTRLTIAEQRWRWFWHHLLDLIIVALPMLRPLRLMRFLTVIALVQRTAGNALRGKVIVYTLGATTLIIFIAALAILDAEHTEGTISTFGQALWWALVTMTTVGYGDFTPTTTTGRVIAAGLMVGGITLIGTVTATLASWIAEKAANESTESKQSLNEEIAKIRTDLSEIRALIEKQHKR